MSTIRAILTGIVLSVLLFKNAPAETGATDVDGVMEGWVVIGHEVRTFTPCGGAETLWLYGNSENMDRLRSEYARTTVGKSPYTPVWMRLSGRYTKSLGAGFAAEYPGAFLVDDAPFAAGVRHCRWEVIRVALPVPGEAISSPLRLSGVVRGNWFFEGDFPVTLETATGRRVGRGFVSAQDDWMTHEFVPFEGTLVFGAPNDATHGTLVFRKDNPSDDRSLDDAMRFPVRFR